MPIQAFPFQRRSTADLLVFAFLLLLVTAASVMANLYGLAMSRAIAEPIRVEVHGLSAGDKDHVAVTFESIAKDPDTNAFAEENSFRVEDRFQWEIGWQWVRDLHVHCADGALSRLAGISVTIGDTTTTYTGDEVRQWARIPLMSWALLNASHADASLRVPSVMQTRTVIAAINLPPKAALVRNVVIPAGWFVVVVAAVCLGIRRMIGNPWLQRFTVRTLAGGVGPAATGSRGWLAFGLGVVLLGVGTYEWSHPYAFTHDDNFCQFLPVVMRSAEDLLAGRIPTWNPYQLLGSATMTVGTYMLTYPPTYLCWALAHFGFGNDHLTLEIFAILHLTVGYLATYWALRRMGVRPPLAATGGFSFALCGWFLVAGSSQFTFLPSAVFLPLLFDAANRLFRADVSWRWSAWAGALIGISFHAGHAQMWTYSVMFFGLAILLSVVSGAISWRRASWTVPALLFGLALAAPLFVLQFRETRDILRFGGYGPTAELSTMLLPLGPLAANVKLPASVHPEYANEMFHFGTAFAATAAVATVLMIALSLVCRPTGFVRPKHWLAGNPWLLPTLIAVLLSLGDQGLLWTAMSSLPVFDKFRWPFKFAPFIAIAGILAGATVMERWLGPRRANVSRWIAVLSAAMMLFHVTLCKSNLYTMADRPYPPFPDAPRRLMEGDPAQQQRFIAISPFRSPAGGYVSSLALNYATLHKLVAFNGYDSFIAATRENRSALNALRGTSVEAAQAYGVRWLLVHERSLHPRFSAHTIMRSSETLLMPDQKALWTLRSHGQLAWHEGDLWLYRLPDPQPMAFGASAPDRPLPITLDQAGVSIATADIPGGDTVTAAYLWRPWMQVRVDGRVMSAQPDAWGRVSVRLPKPARSVRFEYAPPFGFAFAVGGAALLMGLAAGWVAQRLSARTQGVGSSAVAAAVPA